MPKSKTAIYTNIDPGLLANDTLTFSTVLDAGLETKMVAKLRAIMEDPSHPLFSCFVFTVITPVLDSIHHKQNPFGFASLSLESQLYASL